MDSLIDYLSQFTTPRRFQLLKEVAANRTRYITPVLEDIYQPQNASAVLRTCDCLGIQDVHIIEERNRYKLNPDVELGSAQWLNLIRYNKPEGNATAAIQNLKASGYRIVATTPHAKDVSLNNFDLSGGKIALLFGTELKGLSEQAMNLSDEFIRIPMTGFTESYNISVSVAIVAYSLMRDLRNSSLTWRLTDEEQKLLILEWLRKSIKSSE
ncbi:MAG: RNA methyltransferase, partial [Bacteroidia bacterium]|nr:RNA methyltransferase [Bacteroidia bacterium]